MLSISLAIFSSVTCACFLAVGVLFCFFVDQSKKLEEVVGRRQRGHVTAPTTILPTGHDRHRDVELDSRRCCRRQGSHRVRVILAPSARLHRPMARRRYGEESLRPPCVRHSMRKAR